MYGLDLSNCRQEWVSTEFANYAYRVDCSNLGFTRIPANLPGLTSQLILSGNSISSVDQASFDGLTSLHSADLSGNDIVFLEEGAFKDAKDLKVLDLSRNKLRCDWRIWWLVSYARKLESFTGECFTPRALRGRDIKTLKQEDLAVDCLSVKKLTRASEDGEYEMRVFGHDNRITQLYIYCYEMDTESPSEFLSLPSGTTNNYVKIIKDETCSYNNELNEILDTINKTTYFSYVKINLQKLQLIANDTSLHPRSQVVFGKPTVCNKDVCTQGIAKIDLRGTHFQIEGTKSSLQYSKCHQKCDVCHHPNMLTLSIINSKRNPFAACTLPLGMQSMEIQDLEVTASSHSGQYVASQARLNSMKHSGWCAGFNNDLQELVIHLGKKMTLAGISTQGHKTLNKWVTSYEVLYSADGKNYIPYEEIGVKKIFNGNDNQYSVITYWFRPRFTARFVKIRPLTWHNGVCIRVELYGCVSDINSYVMQKIPEDRCLTVGDKVYDRNGSPQYPLVQKSGCLGPDFMFTFHHRKLQHTKTGLCLHLTDQSWFIFNKTCSFTNLMFQKVASQAEESFLIKDHNGYCARIQEADNPKKNKIFSIWRTCHRGGFTIFKLTREGVSAFQPTFERKKTAVVTDLFKPLKLSCRARAEPIPLYEWSRNGSIPQGNAAITEGVGVHSNHVTLTLRNVTWNDRGLYICNAWNSKGYQYKEYNVVVNPMQWFETKPTNQRTIHGEITRFQCVSRGIPDPTVTWITHDEAILEYRNVLEIDPRKYSVMENGTLVIFDSRYNDEKTYICVSESPGLKANVSAKLDVYVTQRFVETPVNQDVLYGGRVVFNCISEGRPKPRVTWQINSVAVDATMKNYEVLQNGSLIVKQALVSDEGLYECVSNSPGLVEKVSASLSVYVTQEFRVAPLPKRTLYGNAAFFNCESIGVPTPKLSWKRKLNQSYSVLITNSNKYTIFENKTLRISNVNYGDEGEYICVSESPRLLRRAQAPLSVYVTQVFTSRPENLVSIQGSIAIFSCISEGVPKPKVSWKFVSSITGIAKLFEDNVLADTRFSVEENSDLVIRDVKNIDEGTYTCISESPRHIVNSSATLTVHIPPVVSVTTANVTIFSSQSTHVTCTAYGDPRPDINWYKLVNGKRVLVSDITERLSFEDGTLSLTKVEKVDQGKYACVASNAAGERDVFVSVHVEVICLLDDMKHMVKPKKYVYTENERVRINCKKGFERIGAKELKCKQNGFFNHPFPKCEDIDECDTEPGSGMINMRTSAPSIDDEPEVCDYNAQCKNTIGSFKCICNEGYMMVRNKCEFSPPGSKSRNPGPDGRKPSNKDPPLQDYSWFDRMIEHYQKRILDEEMYLRKLYAFTRNITLFQYSSWKKEALRRVTTQALNVTTTRTVGTSLPPRTAVTFMELFASIVNEILDMNYQKEWQSINAETCGTACVMRYFEEYTVKISSSTIKGFHEEVNFNSDSLNMKISSINDTYSGKDFTSRMMSNAEQGNSVVMPKKNYPFIKGSTSIAIRYKTIHGLLPEPKLNEISNAKILSDVFSLSFTSLKHSQKLAESAKIIFKVPKTKDTTNDKAVCAYWDFSSGKYGGWSRDGCMISNSSTPTEIICECDHLSNFAVLIPKKPIKMIHLTLGIVVAAGVGLCILLAFATCLSHVCCSNYVNSDRKAILVNITLTIVLGLIMFLGGVTLSALDLVSEKHSQYFCYAFVGCLQLFGCAFFAWIFSEAVHLYLSTRIVINKGNGRLALFYFIGWGIPVMIVAITGVLVYFDKFELQSKCVMDISLYLIGILVGAPSLLYIFATLIMYILIRMSLASDRELLNARVLFHAKGAILCSFCLLLLHVLVLGSATMFLKFNGQIIYHYIFAALAAVEGIYLVFYHCYVDRRAGRTTSRSNSKKRNSYSTKDTVTYSPNGTSSNTEIAEEVTTSEQKFLIKRPSTKRSSKEVRTSPQEVRALHPHSSEEALEWDSAYQGMYGGGSSSMNGGAILGGSRDTAHSTTETKPLLSMRTDTLTEDEEGMIPSTFRAGSISKNSTLSRTSTLPKKWKDLDDTDHGNNLRQSVKRSNSKASSIVSIETHTSSNTQHGLPVFFPAPPPHYEMSLDRKRKDFTMDPYMSSGNTSRRGSFGIESDRMSNISSELSNILYELQAFDTTLPKDSHVSDNNKCTGPASSTLPHRRDPPMTDISHNPMSTFRPTPTNTLNNKRYAKTEVAFDDAKPPSYTDHQRVRVLRGKSRQEADPSDGLHSPSGSMYSSL